MIKSFLCHGEENFSFYVLEECDKEILDEREIFYISKFDTMQPNGYNLTSGGSGVLGYKHNEERRKKISENTPRMSGEKHPMFGKTVSDETKKILRDKNSRENSARFGVKGKNPTSQYHCVYLYKTKTIKNGKEYLATYWVAKLRINRKENHLGYYKTEIEAAKAYDKFVVENGLKNPLNFPEDYDIVDIMEVKDAEDNI